MPLLVLFFIHLSCALRISYFVFLGFLLSVGFITFHQYDKSAKERTETIPFSYILETKLFAIQMIISFVQTISPSTT